MCASLTFLWAASHSVYFSGRFNNNQGVCTSSSATNNGLIYVVDSSNYRLRSVNLTSGNTTWLAGTGVAGTGTIVNGAPFSATFAADSSCVVDALQQNVYIGGSGDQAIRVYNIATGIVSTLAGSATRVAGFADGTGSSASFSSPKGVAIDDSNNVYVGDTTANKIRMITPAGVVTTLAGCASQTAPCPASGADGVGSNAGFDAPRGLTIDPTNTYLLVCDCESRGRRGHCACVELARMQTLLRAAGGGSKAGPYLPYLLPPRTLLDSAHCHSLFFVVSRPLVSSSPQTRATRFARSLSRRAT